MSLFESLFKNNKLVQEDNYDPALKKLFDSFENTSYLDIDSVYEINELDDFTKEDLKQLYEFYKQEKEKQELDRIEYTKKQHQLLFEKLICYIKNVQEEKQEETNEKFLNILNKLNEKWWKPFWYDCDWIKIHKKDYNWNIEEIALNNRRWIEEGYSWRYVYDYFNLTELLSNMSWLFEFIVEHWYFKDNDAINFDWNTIWKSSINYYYIKSSLLKSNYEKILFLIKNVNI